MLGQDKVAWTAARSLIITYGIAAFSFFTLRSAAAGTPASGTGMFVAGIVLQVAVWIANALIKRNIEDAELAAQANYIVALVADALTVMLFAIGTFRAIGAATL
jgi:hypothetical protein